MQQPWEGTIRIGTNYVSAQNDTVTHGRGYVALGDDAQGSSAALC